MSIDAAVLQKLRKILGDENVLTSVEERTAYDSDASKMTGALPDVVVRPDTTEQVARMLELANSKRIPVYARGAGSGLTGGAAPLQGGIVLDFCNMNRILDIDAANMTALVQPGVVTGHLQKQVAQIGLFYPPDPASSDFCTIGGNVAENASGLRGTKYGSTREYVLALEAVLANGDVIRVGSGVPKSVTGYDLTRLLVGSEGTLCIFTEILLRLIPLPEYIETVFADFSTAEHAANAICSIFTEGITPRAAELVDEGSVESLRRYKDADELPREGVFCLIEVDGPRAVAQADAEKIVELCKSHGASTARRAASEEERERFWSLRRALSPAVYALGRVKINEDICVPRTRLAEMLTIISDISRRHQIPIVNFGHAGDGSLHVNLVLERDDPELRARAEEALGEIFKSTIEMGGTLSAEHGIGITKARFLGTELGAKEMAVMARIKNLFDPNGILNPGKFTDALSPHE